MVFLLFDIDLLPHRGVIAFIGWCRLNQLILAISAGEMPLGSPPPFAVNAQINSILSFLILSGFMYFLLCPINIALIGWCWLNIVASYLASLIDIASFHLVCV